jgi:hypothetical protein
LQSENQKLQSFNLLHSDTLHHTPPGAHTANVPNQLLV